MVPRGFLPWWLSLPVCVLTGAAAHWVEPPNLAFTPAAVLAVTMFCWGALVRRGNPPSVARFWSAVVLAIGAFLATLMVFVNEASLLPITLGSLAAAACTYLAVMSLRRDLFRKRC